MTRGNTPCGIALPLGLIERTGGMSALGEYVARAEALPYDSLWLAESILSKAFSLEPLSLLSYVAALTTRLRLGVSVMLLTLRNPLQLAKAAATLDYVSNGRFDLGIGLGHGREATFGYTREGRVRRFEESLAVMKKVWAEKEVSFAGEYWQFEGVNMEPKPVQRATSASLVWGASSECVATSRAVGRCFYGGWVIFQPGFCQPDAVHSTIS